MSGTPVPPIQRLTRRLAETPSAFLAPVAVGAVLSDVLADLRHEPLDDQWLDALSPQRPSEAQVAWLRACAVVAWLIADPAVGAVVETHGILRLLGSDLHTVADHVRAEDFVGEDDRREELARLLLRAAGVTPAGETPAQAADRLATLDTATRLRVIAEARAAEAHSAKVRQALARKRAQEAAAKATRE